MTERYRADILQARKRLSESCRGRLNELLNMGYRGKFWIGEVDGGIQSYEIRNRKIYESSQHQNERAERIIKPSEIPFERFGLIDKGTIDSLVRAAEVIEATLEKSRKARAHSSKPQTVHES